MNRPAFDKQGRQIAWDATAITALQECKRKYYYKIVKGLIPKTDELSIHLVFGGEFARSIEEFWKLFFEIGDKEEALNSVVYAMMCRSYNNPSYSRSTSKSRFNLIKTFVWYIDEFFTIDSFQIYHEDGQPMLERSFALDTGDLILCGRIDRVITIEDNLFIMDQKTTGSTVDNWFFKTFTPNNQVSCYLTAGMSIFARPVKGFVVDAITIQVNNSSFLRGFVQRTKAYLEEWYEGIVKETSFVRDADPELEKDWPQNPNACGYYNGCEYREVCSLSPKARPTFLNQFEISYWDSSKGLRDGETE